MSDCSSSAMEPRTCGTCGHVRETRLNCFYAANDKAYYAGCTSPDAMACEHYFDDLDLLPRRYERLAQMAREMYWAIDVFESRLDAEHESLFEWVPERGAVTRGVKEQLEALGVSVDD